MKTTRGRRALLVKRLLLTAGALVALAAAAAWLAVRASMPVLDGERQLAGLGARVDVARDALGVPTVRARSREDAARATGFLHAQERFFQMDLLRRDAAGELAALVGETALEHDVARRVHRLRATARRVIAQAEKRERAIVEAYTQGVNAGLEALRARPFEYFLLRARPQRWRPEDTVLVVYAMYFVLHGEQALRESYLGRMHETLPPAMFEFIVQGGTRWDAPIAGGALRPRPIPDAGICDLRRVDRGRLAAVPRSRREIEPEEAVSGSNGWAVAGWRAAGRGAKRGAILANDMHLHLRLPNTWYRLRLVVDGTAQGEEDVDVTGATLPGTPAVVVGSNGRVAWGFTNSEGDWADLVLLETDPGNPGRYRTGRGFRDFDEHVEIIDVRGGPSERVVVRDTLWGPVVGTDHLGRQTALAWTAHHPEATNFALRRLEAARDVFEALEVAHGAGIPPQNLVLADAAGNVAWTIIGRIPRRRGYDPRLPSAWSLGRSGWFGWLAAAEYPTLLNPPEGRVWSANARVVGGTALEKIGDGGYDLGARAGQIRDRLAAIEEAGVDDMLAIQLDHEARFLAHWRELLVATLSGDADPRRAELRRIAAGWHRRASVGSAGYRLLRAFRRAVHDRVLGAVLAGCGDVPLEFRPARLRQAEGPLWQLVSARPRHLLDPRFSSWDALLLEAADAAASTCAGEPLSGCTWGEANVVHLRHPLGRAVPALSPWLDLAPEPLPGDAHMPRVQEGVHGASERFAVAPGRESQGYFHMPGGQSGHPLSPHYRAGHRAWAAGEPLPFLPGPAEHRLTLRPGHG